MAAATATKTNTSGAKKLVRIPEELHARLVERAAELLEGYEAGQVTDLTLTENGSQVFCPLWAVIERALDKDVAHRDRSRAAGRKAAAERKAAGE